MDDPQALAVGVDGLRLHVAAYRGPEDGAPVLLMHGGMAHGGWYAPLARVLGAKLRPFALDRRGHGRSDWADVDRYGWEHDLRDAEHAAAEIDPGPWIVVGHSQGGLLSVHLALRGRLPLRGLVILDSPFEPRAPALVRSGRAFRRMPQVRYPTLASALRRFQPYPTPHRVPDDLLQAIARESFKPTDDGGFVSRFHWKRFQADEGSPHPLESFTDDLGRIPTPTLVIRGEASTILSADDHESFVSRVPDADGAVIPGTTHSLHVERPEAVARAILDFASRLGRGSPRQS